jgi:hypothetical protein
MRIDHDNTMKAKFYISCTIQVAKEIVAEFLFDETTSVYEENNKRLILVCSGDIKTIKYTDRILKKIQRGLKNGFKQAK